ncbi:hypothetical protein LNQ81_09335 [Myroides sp. M-43]|uniref:hypothetical protein n=1 Tax=Myroides oncorhynchi TaxID=2893756 RepID=UPI001E2B826E|nr:hypothetical protein [Myroides oncorhynchi]MCC9042877.1 hypothetical protein [Myroides oncorhynchi]
MKKIYLFLLGLSLSLQSCVTKEELYVKDNGAIDYNFKMDFKELLQSVPDKNAIFKGEGDKIALISGQELSVDQILDFAMLKEKNGAFKKDSIIKANKELFDNTKNVRFMINMKDSLADFNLKVNAKDITDLNQSLININKITEKTNELDKKKDSKKQPPLLVESNYSLSKKQFERKVVTKGEDKAKDMGELGAMAGMFSYVLKVNFDKPIQSVSLEGAKIAEDKKSFEKTFSMTDIVANPKVLEYKVEFK